MVDEVQYKVTLDDTDILNALDDIATEVKDLARVADKQFDSVEDAIFDVLDATKSLEKGFQKTGRSIASTSKLSGTKIGAISGIVSSLTTEFINLGKQAITTLVNVGKEAVTIASGYETLRARLIGIFDGSQQAADEAFTFIQGRSRELGIDLSELAGAFLPQVENLEQFERVAKLATALARSDPEQGAVGARIALIEALSGTFTSLQRRFELPAAEIDKLQAAFETEGIEGFLSTLEQVLDDAGKGFDDLGGTAQASFDKARIQGEQLLGVLGEPVLNELKQQFDDIGAIVAENADDFELVATAIGQVLANVIDLIGTNFAEFLQNLDTEQVLRVVDDFQGIVESARNLSEILANVSLSSGFLDSLEFVTSSLETALQTAVQISVIAKAEVARRQAEEAVRAEQGLTALGGFVSFAGTEEQQAKQLAAGQEAYNQAFSDALPILEKNKQITDDYSKSLDDFTQSQKDASEAGTDEADTLLRLANAAREAERIQGELAAALDKLAKLEEDAAEKRIDIIRKAGQKRLDTEEDFIEKRLDTARDFLRKVEDIERKNAQSIEDSDKDLDRDREDIQRDFSRKQIDIEKESAKDRIKIEEDFRDEIRKIQSRFEADSEEAARNRDAVTFLRLQRERDRQIDEAKITRTKKVDESRKEATEKRAELQQELQFELEDARIADERRLEDLAIRLQRELEENRLNNERELQNLITNEDRKRQELERSQERQLAEAKIANDRRVADFKESLNEEVLAAIEAEQRKTDIFKEQQERRQTLAEQPSKFQLPEYLVSPGRQHGGPVGAGQSVTVGERGPEIFTPQVAGNVIPLGPNITSPLAASNVVSTINNVTNASVNQSMLDPSQQSAMMRAIAANVASETVRRIISG